jgi:hypothetical protein
VIDQTSEQLAEYRRFRQVAREFLEVNERVCDAKLQQTRGAAAAEAAEKRGSKRRSRKRSHAR